MNKIINIFNIYLYKFIICLSDHSMPNNFNLIILLLHSNNEIELVSLHGWWNVCWCQEIAVHFPSNPPIDQVSRYSHTATITYCRSTCPTTSIFPHITAISIISLALKMLNLMISKDQITKCKSTTIFGVNVITCCDEYYAICM